MIYKQGIVIGERADSNAINNYELSHSDYDLVSFEETINNKRFISPVLILPNLIQETANTAFYGSIDPPSMPYYFSFEITRYKSGRLQIKGYINSIEVNGTRRSLGIITFRSKYPADEINDIITINLMATEALTDVTPICYLTNGYRQSGQITGCIAVSISEQKLRISLMDSVSTAPPNGNGLPVNFTVSSPISNNTLYDQVTDVKEEMEQQLQNFSDGILGSFIAGWFTSEKC